MVFGGDFSGAATQVGSAAADTLTGTSASDVIFAGPGDDVIDGNGGDDRLSGAQGADTFVVRDLTGTVTIIDFDGGTGQPGDEGDQLDLSAFGFADFAAVQAVATAHGPGGHDTLLTLDADTFVVLEDVAPDILDSSNVIL